MEKKSAGTSGDGCDFCPRTGLLSTNQALVIQTTSPIHPQSIRGGLDAQLEVRGRARREAARRRKSEWKVNLGNRNSFRSSGRWRMTTKTVS